MKIYHPLLALIASSLDSELAQYVQYLKQENKILCARREEWKTKADKSQTAACEVPRGFLKAWRFVIHSMSGYVSGNAVSCIMGD